MTSTPLTTIVVNGIPTAQIVQGEGRPLLMLHGWGAHSGLVWPLAQVLIPKGYRVYIPDLCGFGQTPEPTSAWSVYDYAAFAVDYLQAHGLERVDFFGHSFGGRLGLVLGAKYPQYLHKMVLADSAGVRTPEPLSRKIAFQSLKVLYQGLLRIGWQGLAEGSKQWYTARYASFDFKQVSGLMRETFVNVVKEDLLPIASQVQVPTLLFWGDKDEDTPLWQGKALEKAIPDAGLIIHEGAGHYSYLDRLHDTAHIMDYFLAGKRAS